MTNLYQLMDDKTKENFVPEAEFDKDAWAAAKQEARTAAFDLMDQAAAAVNIDAGTREQYLDVMAQFPHHAVSNSLLIFAQKPDATRIGDSDYWSKQSARVKKGERAFSIIVPGKNEFTREDGSVGTFFDVKKVFDVSQTTAPHRSPRIYDATAVTQALITKAPVGITPVENLGGEFAVFNPSDNVIEVQTGLSENQLFFAIATELSHASMAQGDANYDRERNTNKAELAATVLAKRYGIECSRGETQAPANDSAEPQDIRAALTQVDRAAKDVGSRMDEVLDRPKERDNSRTR